MKKAIFLAALAACLFTACQKEQNAPAGTTLTAEILQTRTSLQNDLKVLWSAGDQINVNGVVSKPVAAAGASATFQFDAVIAAPYKAVYPAAATQDGACITLPDEQAAADGTFADGVAPMIAYAESGTSLQFKHVFAYVRVPVKSAATIASVTFKGNNGEQVCGDFDVDYAAGQVNTTDATDANQAVKVLVGKSEATLVIAVPAQTYGQGFTLTAQDANGNEFKYIKPSSCELVAGQVNTLPEVVFEAVPEGEGSGTLADPYLIKTAADLQAMASKGVFGQTVYFKMMDNIDMSGITEWTPFDVEFNNAAGAQGIVFDGNHKVISNWNWVNTASKYPGFIGVLHGVVKDLVFADCSIETTYGSPIGLVCGWCGVSNATLHGRIENVHAIRCSVKSSVNNNNLGGLAGSSNNADFINSSFDGTVERTSADNNAYVGTGGLVGYFDIDKFDSSLNPISANVVEGCHTSGMVRDVTRSTGGLIGRVHANTTLHLKDCYSTCTVYSKFDVVGGITGYWGGGTLENCWFKGEVISEKTGSSFVGGLVPHTNWGIEFYNCHSEGIITCPGDIVGGILGQCNAVADRTDHPEDKSGPCIIKECWSTMTLNGAKGYAGGIVGRSSTVFPLTVENCWYSGTINANGASGQSIGGIVGDCPKNSIVKNCWNDADIIAGFGMGGIAGRMFGRQGSSASADDDVNSSMTGCIYWGPGIQTTNTTGGERCSDHYSSGAMIGFSSRPNTLKDNYRNPAMTFNVFKYAPLNELYDHADSNPSTPLVEPYSLLPEADWIWFNKEDAKDYEDFKYYSPYNGKAAPAGATVSSLAKTIGWDEAIWDLSGDYPMLKNTPNL